ETTRPREVSTRSRGRLLGRGAVGPPCPRSLAVTRRPARGGPCTISLSVLRRLAELGQPPRLHLPDPLPGEVHDLPHLLDGHPALLRAIEGAGVLQLPDLLVREVELDRPGLRVHVQVEVVLAGDEEAGPGPVDAVGPGPWAAGVHALEQLLLLRVHLSCQ